MRETSSGPDLQNRGSEKPGDRKTTHQIQWQRDSCLIQCRHHRLGKNESLEELIGRADKAQYQSKDQAATKPKLSASTQTLEWRQAADQC